MPSTTRAGTPVSPVRGALALAYGLSSYLAFGASFCVYCSRSSSTAPQWSG